jgi:hypothetical protein
VLEDRDELHHERLHQLERRGDRGYPREEAAGDRLHLVVVVHLAELKDLGQDGNKVRERADGVHVRELYREPVHHCCQLGRTYPELTRHRRGVVGRHYRLGAVGALLAQLLEARDNLGELRLEGRVA